MICVDCMKTWGAHNPPFVKVYGHDEMISRAEARIYVRCGLAEFAEPGVLRLKNPAHGKLAIVVR